MTAVLLAYPRAVLLDLVDDDDHDDDDSSRCMRQAGSGWTLPHSNTEAHLGPYLKDVVSYVPCNAGRCLISQRSLGTPSFLIV